MDIYPILLIICLTILCIFFYDMYQLQKISSIQKKISLHQRQLSRYLKISHLGIYHELQDRGENHSFLVIQKQEELVFFTLYSLEYMNYLNNMYTVSAKTILFFGKMEHLPKEIAMYADKLLFVYPYLPEDIQEKIEQSITLPADF